MLKVLVWGSSNVGACAFFRAGQLFDEPFRSLGVEVRRVSALDYERNRIIDRAGDVIGTTKMTAAALLAMLDRGDAKLDAKVDTEPLEWADLVLFRRYYIEGRDVITRAVWEAVETMPNGPAIVYDCDDDL